jgi:hypothetical protein
MGIYNQEQLVKDLNLIVSTFGYKKQYGIFVYNAFESVNLAIIAKHIGEPTIRWAGKFIEREDADTMFPPGSLILKYALKAEELKKDKADAV